MYTSQEHTYGGLVGGVTAKSQTYDREVVGSTTERVGRYHVVTTGMGRCLFAHR